jgi:hypothetical protein
MSSTKIGCPLCIHNHFDGTCAAFPQEIPLPFVSGEKAHTATIAGQENSIVFERGTPDQLRGLAVAAIEKAKQPA